MTDIDELIEKSQKLLAYDFGDESDYCIDAATALGEAVDTLVRLRDALTDAREAIASLEVDDLGFGQEPHDILGVNVYPLRDELLVKIDAALTTTKIEKEA